MNGGFERVNQVRSAIARAAEPFTLRDIVQLAGAHISEADALRQVMRRLELAREIVMEGKTLGKARYRRTGAFRAEEPGPEEGKHAGDLLQALVLAWGAARPSDRVRYTPEPHAD